MVIVYLILRLWFWLKDTESDNAARSTLAEQDEKEGIEPENEDLWRHLFGVFQENWLFGDRSLVPPEYRAYFMVSKKARTDYAQAWVADQEQRLGWKPFCRPKGDQFENFERRWGTNIREYNKRKEVPNVGTDVER